MNELKKGKVGAVLVVGGGIAGIQSSLDLAELGFKVFLIESSSAIGGIMSQLDKTFPTNDCSMCILSPKLVEAGRHQNIQIITLANIDQIEGKAGNFTVRVRKRPRYIDEEKCTGCGLCSTYCPIETLNEYDEGLRKRRSISIKYPQAIPKLPAIDREICIGCRLCEYICEAKAINFSQEEEYINLNVGAIILAQGCETFDPSFKRYGYGKYPNVITSTEFERVLSASGPFIGHVLRPSDGKIPSKIAWIQCVGSRDKSIGNTYCSSVCCMYAIKEATIALEHNPGIDCNIFYIDMRTVGKEFEEYYLRAQDLGIKFLKGRVGSIRESITDNNLILAHENLETGEIIEESYDLVVLSVGFKPPGSLSELKTKFGIDLNEYNFCSTNYFAPLETSENGIYVCGTLSGPKDIPETVAEASGVAAKASALLYEERNTMVTAKEYPPELKLEGQKPRVGVFVCHCGINIGGVVDVPKVVEFAKSLPDVVYVEENIYTCSQDTQEKIKKVIKEHGLNRVVVASCTPRTHEPLFQNTIREVGLNPFLFELANIREHCSWVHMKNHEEATEKAKDIVAMTIAKASLLEPIHESSVDVTKACLVIGGGIAGLTAALEVANQGFNVYLIEKSVDLGGNVNNLHHLLEFGNPQIYIQNLIEQVVNHRNIKVVFKATIDSVEGFIGNYRVAINSLGKSDFFDVGTIIVATGGKEYKPSEYNYGLDDRILTQRELEERIAKNTVSARTIVMIQCVGSRNEERPYCSRICCTHAIKNALRLKEKNPDINICILYKDIRTYGFKENYYREAREKGIIFIRFDESQEPVVDISNKKLSVKVKDSMSGNLILLKPDLIALSAAFLPEENVDLSKLLKVPVEQNGFFLEAHVKLRPLDFATDGIFLCGAAQWPKFVNETIAQSQGAAARACTVLSKDKLKVLSPVAEIDEDKCIGCGECREICMYDAIEVNEIVKEFKAIFDSTLPSTSIIRHKSKVRTALCKGCGSCVGFCPVGALSVKHFTNPQLSVMIETYLTQRGEISETQQQ
ncbi:MAG: FAD-dependent oxidoreductase [Candidatus Hodarchaeota archaeon]